ncbi:DUF1697 domain-containing protein [Kineococcus terrestris]|uniref:DUF1697 domain-containing protein n=1 Tax=Kineococcus terrestris TaxID=2044856 RepID=UPI0034DB0038
MARERTTGRPAVRWVLLLRGVNVGRITVRGAALSACLTGAGFTGVRTVLASGNAVVDVADEAGEAGPAGEGGADGAEVVRARAEAALRAGFGYEAWVVAMTPARLAEVADGWPFGHEEGVREHCVLTSDPARLADLHATAPVGERERVRLAGDVLYWAVPAGSSTDTPFARALAAARWKPHVTTRTVRTLRRVLTAAEAP